MGSALEFKNLEFPIRYTIKRYSSNRMPNNQTMMAIVPRIPQEIVDCVHCVFSNPDDAATGACIRGTSFVFAVDSETFGRKKSYYYAVTNRHVVAKGGHVIRINTAGHRAPEIIVIDPIEWEYHADGYDIAVSRYPLEFADSSLITFIDLEGCATQDHIKKANIGVGDDVFMAGTFVDLEKTMHNQPTVRFGNISSMPIPVINETTNKKVNSYLLDMHSRSGYSGSPVMVFRTRGGNFNRRSPNDAVPESPPILYFLGIHWGQFPDELTAKLNGEPVKIIGHSGMTLVHPAEYILEVLMSEKLRDIRAMKDKE